MCKGYSLHIGKKGKFAWYDFTMKLSHVMMLPLMFHLCKCQADTPKLHISGCDSKGTITVKEINFTFTCTGIALSKGVEWELHFINGTRIPIGMCNSQNCWKNLRNVNLQWKNDTVNELVILQFDTSWNDSLLECEEENNLSKASCKITLPSRTSTEIKTDTLSATMANTPLLSTLHTTKISETQQTPISSSSFDESNSSRFSSSPLVSTLHSTMKLSVILSTLSSTDLPSSPSRDLYWIIGCTIAALAVFIFIVFAIVYNKRKQRRADDCYNRIDVMGNRIKPLWPNPMYDHITL